MPVTIKTSKIQGKGVFAGRSFKKGDIVMLWDHFFTLTKSEARKIPKRYRKYLVFYRGKFILMQGPAKFINHSCEPNTKEGNLCDIALRNIKKGEELTTDYSIEYPPHEKMRCRCKSKLCKKII
ncbi:MAG: SET domain-containing protein [Nanoarchaeota archaeon]